MKTLKLLVGVVLLAWLTEGCSKSSPSGGADSVFTVSGKIAASSREDRFTAAGSTLQCATLTATPISGSGVADSSGNVSASFAGAGLPINCVVMPPNSTNSIPLLLSSGGTSGSMAKADSALSLGDISVVTNGNGTVVAGATLPATASLQTTTPPGLSCLAGTWTSVTNPESCNGSPTTYKMFFSQLPDGSFANSYVKTNGMINTLHLTGTTTTGSNCITVNSTDGLAVGMTVDASESWFTNPGGKGILPITRITSLTACGAGQVQVADPAGGMGGSVSDAYLVTVCGTTGYNTKDITYSAANNTVSVKYPKACYDVAFSKLTSVNAGGSGSAGFIADLTPGSKCLSNLKLPTGSLGTTVITVNTQLADANNGVTYFPAANGTKITAIPGTCSAGSFQMSVSSLATGTALLSVYNLALGTNYVSYDFYASVTSGSPCVTPALPVAGALTGYFVGDSTASLSSAAGNGITLVPAAGNCTGSGMLPYMLSEAAGTNATAGETVTIVPPTTTGCFLGACFDSKGNAYTGGSTCPTGASALTAQTQVDTMTINADCTRIWAKQVANCRSAFDLDASIGAHCGAGQTTANTPAAAVRARYTQSNTGCAACFPGPIGAPSDFPLNGCVGYGNVTCTANNSGIGDGNNIVVIKQ